MEIYYCYKKSDGTFMGSGTPQIDNAEVGNTTVASPEYDRETEIPVFDDINQTWSLQQL